MPSLEATSRPVAFLVLVADIFGTDVAQISLLMQRGDPLRRVGPFVSPKVEKELLAQLLPSDQVLVRYLHDNRLISGRVISPAVFSFQDVLSEIAAHPHLFVRRKRFGSIRCATKSDRDRLLPRSGVIEKKSIMGRLLQGVVDILEDSSLKVTWVYDAVSVHVPMAAFSEEDSKPYLLIGNDGVIYARDIVLERKWLNELTAALGVSDVSILSDFWDKVDLRRLSCLPKKRWRITLGKRSVTPEVMRFDQIGSSWFKQESYFSDAFDDAVIEAYLRQRRHIQSGSKAIFLPPLCELKDDNKFFLKLLAQGNINIPIDKITSINRKFSQTDRKSQQQWLEKCGFRSKLRDYQLDGVLWLIELWNHGLGGILADEMGLGKTVQALAFITSKRIHSTLIVCPASLIPNWKMEISRFIPGIMISEEIANEFPKEKQSIAIVSYQHALRKVEKCHARLFDFFILDEGQFVKNRETKTSLALRKFEAHFRLVLTGTPIENSTHDLWAHLTFSNSFFEQVYQRLQRRFPEFGRSKIASEISIKAFSGLLMRRTKADVELDLPPMTERIVYCDMKRGQRAVYDSTLSAFNRMMKNGLAGRINSIMLEGLLRLRQCCSHPLLLPSSLNPNAVSESVKMDTALKIVEDNVAAGRKTIIFSQFRKTLDVLEDILRGKGIVVVRLDGNTQDRDAPVKLFQTDETVKVFIIGFRAGGFGLNLTAAESIILFDPWWNPAAEQQAFARAHRIGQRKSVFISKLICSNTVEEKMLTLVASKVELSSVNVDVSHRISSDELIKLIRE